MKDCDKEVSKLVCVNIDSFRNDVRSLTQTLPIVIRNMVDYTKCKMDELNKHIESKGTKSIKNKMAHYKLNYEDNVLAEKLEHNIEIGSRTIEIIPCSYIVTLVGMFEAFLQNLVKGSLLVKPQILNGTENTLNISQVKGYGSINELVDYMVESEVEKGLRGSYKEKILWIEKKLNLKLIVDVKLWSKLIEITERRHLFAHCDGRVSRQYLNICRENNVDLTGIKIGERLTVCPQYFKESSECVFEVGIVISQMILRKIFPDNIKCADCSIVEIVYDLIKKEEYLLAERILIFAKSIERFNSEENKKIVVINLAILYKLTGKNREMENILKSEDWSACSDKFKLAVTILSDQASNSIALMKKIGNKGEIKKDDYKEWPLFTFIKKTVEFRNAFKEIFGEEYVNIEREIKR